MRFKLLLLALLAVGLLPQAYAHTFTFSWTDPLERTDGAPLDPDAELAGYTLRCTGPEEVQTQVQRSDTVRSGDERMYQWSSGATAWGTYRCDMNAIDSDGRASAFSNAVPVDRLEPIPDPPAPPQLNSVSSEGLVSATRTRLQSAYHDPSLDGETLTLTVPGVPAGALVLVHQWHRMTPAGPAAVDGFTPVYDYNPYPSESQDRRGIALHYLVTETDGDVTVTASWPNENGREWIAAVEVYEGPEEWVLLDHAVTDNGTDGAAVRSVTGTVTNPDGEALAVASWGGRGQLGDVVPASADVFAFGGEGQTEIGAALVYERVRGAGDLAYTLAFSGEEVNAGVALFGYAPITTVEGSVN